MPGRGTANAFFIVRRMQEEYKDKKLYKCFVDLETAFDRVPRSVIQFSPEPLIMIFAIINSFLKILT